MDEQSLTYTRRTLVGAGGAVGAAVWIGLHPGLARALGATGSASVAGTPDYLQRSTYVGLSSTGFTDVTGGSQTVLQLSQVADLADPSLTGADDAFSLALTSSDTSMPQGIRTLSHPEIGQFSVFIAPVGAPGAGATYEVIVDRSVPSGTGPASAVTTESDAAPAAAPAGTPAAPVASTPGPTGVTAAPQAVKDTPTVEVKVPAAAHTAAVRRLVVRRNARGLAIDVYVAVGADVRSLRVALRHAGHRLAAEGAKVHAARTRVQLPTAHRLAAGHYEAVVTANLATGAPQITVFPITLR